MNPLKQKLTIGSRDSQLAKAQVKEVFDLLAQKGVRPNYTFTTYHTQGDKDKITSLTTNPADDFFTDTLDKAVLSGEIDVAIHSAKDLPQHLKEGLSIFALTPSLDETDAFVGRARLSKLKKGAKIGTSSLLRKQTVERQFPHLKVVDIRGTIQERIAQIESGRVDGVIIATCALKRLGLSHLIKEILPYEATPLQGQLAVVGKTGDQRLKELFMPIDVRLTFGKVKLVGAGPGDPELISVKAIKALKEADVVFYDYLIDKTLLKYAFKAEKIYVGKRKGAHALPQMELCKMLREKAAQGKNVVRLKGGDPLVFGRGAEEITYLQSYHIQVEVIPGISSATGLPSVLGIPLTARGISSSVAFISGHSEAEDRKHPTPVSIPKVDTVIFLMGITKLNIIVKSLSAAGWSKRTPVVVISQGTMPMEKVVSGTITDIETLVTKANLQQPALIVAGKIVDFYKAREILKENILYLGTNPKQYRHSGNIIHLPMIEITAKKMSKQTIRRMLANLDKYHLILLTSRFGVRYFFDILKEEKYPIAQLRKIDFAVIGAATARKLREFHIEPNVIACSETSQGLLEVLTQKYNLKRMNILFPRSALTNPFLKKELTKRGAKVKEWAVYENTKPAKRNLPRIPIHKIIFTSPSTVKNFLKDYGTIPTSWKILCKGPVTGGALRKAGYDSDILMDEMQGSCHE